MENGMKAKLPTIVNDLTTLKITKTQMTQIIKKTDDNDLHIAYLRMKELADLFIGLTKQEFISRVKKFKKKTGQQFITELGQLIVAVRNNFKLNVSLTDFKTWLSKNKIAEEEVFKYDYVLTTKNKKVLDNLVSKGYATIKESVDWKGIENVAKVHKDILDFVDNDPTEYIKGL
jgi:hypothetical protein